MSVTTIIIFGLNVLNLLEMSIFSVIVIRIPVKKKIKSQIGGCSSITANIILPSYRISRCVYLVKLLYIQITHVLEEMHRQQHVKWNMYRSEIYFLSSFFFQYFIFIFIFTKFKQVPRMKAKSKQILDRLVYLTI